MADDQATAIEHTPHAPVDPTAPGIPADELEDILGPKSPGDIEAEEAAAKAKETEQPDGEPKTEDKSGEGKSEEGETTEQPKGELGEEPAPHDPARGLNKTLQKYQQALATQERMFTEKLDAAEARMQKLVKSAEPKVDMVAEAIEKAEKEAEAKGEELNDVAKAVIKNTVGPMQVLLDKQQEQIDELAAAKTTPPTEQVQQSQREDDAKAWIGSELGVTDKEQAETIFALATTAHKEELDAVGGEEALKEAYGPKGYEAFTEKLLRDAAATVTKNATPAPAPKQKDTSASTDGTEITATGKTGTDLKTTTQAPATDSEEFLERFEAGGGVINLHDE